MGTDDTGPGALGFILCDGKPFNGSYSDVIPFRC